MSDLVALDVRYVATSSPRGIIIAKAGYTDLNKGYSGDIGPRPAYAERVVTIHRDDARAGCFSVLRHTEGDVMGRYEGYALAAAPEFHRAWDAGEDWRPLVDHLIETYPDQLDWLAEAVGRVRA